MVAQRKLKIFTLNDASKIEVVAESTPNEWRQYGCET
jgi:hypothetical protein